MCSSDLVEFQHKNRLLKNRSLRQAIHYALDKKELARLTWKNEKLVAQHFVPPSDPALFKGEDSSDKYSGYDKETAKSLLEGLGWKLRKKNGLRYDVTGRRLSLSLVTNRNHLERRKIAHWIKNQLFKVGIEVKVSLVSGKEFFKNMINKYAFEAMALYAQNIEYPIHSGVFKEKFQTDFFRIFPGSSREAFLQSNFSPMLQKYNQGIFPKNRNELLEKFLDQYQFESLQVPLFFRPNYIVIPSELKGMETKSAKFPNSFLAEYWLR